ncbi:MAG TPA: thioredoxin domain-containing protein, partial [Anaerolineae bacterium]
MKHTNRLVNETSPYLLQHAHNPVDWQAWNEEALAQAKQEDKPIFLSIGYSSCHWCHVMEKESFEDKETADILNKHFVPIKVDREERPDLDSIYMDAVVAMTGQGGWPMSVFLSPEGTPFYGGTYFPNTRRYGMPAFQDVLLGIANAWQNNRDELLRGGERVRQALTHDDPNLGSPPTRQDLADAVSNIHHAFDWTNGGWGGAPKFPQ